MSAAASVIAPESAPGAHIVQFYDVDETVLVENVARYLAAGLLAGERALAITTPAHQAAFIAELEQAGVATATFLADEQLCFIDAESALELFMVDGYPDAERFEEVVGRVVRHARDGSRAGLRAYGEMVGILWTRGEYPAAIRLEQLWHRLLKTIDFRLFCAYEIDIFGEQFEAGLVDAVLCAHTHLLPHVPDEELERALGRAMREVLHPNVTELHGDELTHRALWPSLPRGVASVLWLRGHEPARAREILDRARAYYQAARVARQSGGLRLTGRIARSTVP